MNLLIKFSEASINFLDLNVKFCSGKLQTSFYAKPTDCINTFTFNQVIPNTHKSQ